jgi:anti-sigma regulatory factor (Ser/Thr protein kinase)
VKHAYRRPEGVVEIDASIEHGIVTVSVRDQGTWRDALVESDDGGGRGIPLIRSLTDHDTHSDGEGTTVSMRRRLSSRPAAASPPASL